MSISEDFTADEMTFINSRGEDGAALDRAYSDESDLPPHPGMEQEENPNGAKKDVEAPQKAEDETGDDDADGDEDGSRASKTVPHGQFHKERVRRQAAETEANELKLKFARAEERLAILNELVQGGGARQHGDEGQQNGKANGEAKSAWDEPDIDPLDDFSAAMDQLRRRQVEDRDSRTNWQKQTEARTHDSEQSNAYVRDAVAYAKQNPAFAGAYQHLMQTYHRELEAFGMTDKAQRNAHIRNEEKGLAKYALENGRRPAEIIMQMAQARGFVLGQQQADPAPSDADAGQDLEAAADEVKGKVQNIKKAAKSSASLSNAGGGAKNGLTMESILNMDDDEFFEKVHKMPASKRKKLIAG